jgi:3-oxoacyl-[acyl-carrier-protein] synthase-3
MSYAAITGWGNCLPPAVLTNKDLSTFLDTDDEWITTRTGMKERRVSHVPISTLAHVAACRALAAAGKSGKKVELIIFGTTTPDQICPSTSSHIQKLLESENAACMDLNTACTGFLYSLTVATSMIKTGVVKNAIVIGAEVISPIMDWNNRNVAVLFGDGAAAFFLEACEKTEGLLGEELGCFGEVRDILTVHGWGMRYANQGIPMGQSEWQFEGREIFKKAVIGMARASEKVLKKCGLNINDIDLVVPHQANLRIIKAVAKRAGFPEDKVFVNVQRYGNMSAATVPVALVKALEEGRINPKSRILIPAFGAGLTWCAHIIQWGERIAPLSVSDIQLPTCDKTGLELVAELRANKALFFRAPGEVCDGKKADLRGIGKKD